MGGGIDFPKYTGIPVEENKNVGLPYMTALHFNALIRCRWILFHHDFPYDGGAVRSDFQEIDPFCEGGDVDNLFANHKAIAEALGIDFYFAHPYHSWERGANENMNGLIRQYIPKGTSLEDIDDEYIEMTQEKLNNRPRKKMGF